MKSYKTKNKIIKAFQYSPEMKIDWIHSLERPLKIGSLNFIAYLRNQNGITYIQENDYITIDHNENKDVQFPNIFNEIYEEIIQ